MSLTKDQIEEVEDLFQLEYSELILNIHALLEDECQGHNLYEKGHPWDLNEFFKAYSTGLINIVEKVVQRDEFEKLKQQDADDFY